MEINKFEGGRWQKSAMYEPKTKNFRRCKIKAAVFDLEFLSQKTVHPNGTITLNGSDVDILHGIADLLNSEMEIKLLSTLGSWGQVWLEFGWK